MKKTFNIILGIVVVAALAYACKSEKAATSTTTKTATATTNKTTSTSTTVKKPVAPITTVCEENVTYASAVKTILDERCIGCHSGSRPAHNLDFTTYQGAVAGANHNMECTITGGSCPKMPPGGARLTPEQVESIKCWIKNGTPE